VSWCVGCWSVCPGKDAQGFCLLANRAEIDARIARMHGGPYSSWRQTLRPFIAIADSLSTTP